MGTLCTRGGNGGLSMTGVLQNVPPRHTDMTELAEDDEDDDVSDPVKVGAPETPVELPWEPEVPACT